LAAFCPYDSTLTASLYFSLQSDRAHRDLHSFPTRRSSDLHAKCASCKFNGLFLSKRLTETAVQILGFSLENTDRIIAAQTAVNIDRKSTRLNSSHVKISYAVFCLKKKNGRLTGGEEFRPAS